MAQRVPTLPTAEEYLAREAMASEKSEYRAGRVVAMSGGSLNHGRLVHALGGELREATKGTPCESFGSEIKLRIELTDAYYYPDAMIVCGELDVESETNGIVRNPTVVFEVLSPGTMRFDGKGKFLDYQTVASIREVVFLWSERKLAERYERQDDGSWRYTAYLGDTLPLGAAGIKLDLAALYARLGL